MALSAPQARRAHPRTWDSPHYPPHQQKVLLTLRSAVVINGAPPRWGRGEGRLSSHALIKDKASKVPGTMNMNFPSSSPPPSVSCHHQRQPGLWHPSQCTCPGDRWVSSSPPLTLSATHQSIRAGMRTPDLLSASSQPPCSLAGRHPTVPGASKTVCALKNLQLRAVEMLIGVSPL